MQRVYSSALTGAQWEIIAPWLPPAKPRGRPREVDLRGVVNAIFYVVRSGCAWRMLPKEYPPWQTVYYSFARFKREGIWQKIHDALRTRVRVHHGRHPQLAAAILDSPSVKTTEKGGRGGTMRARR